MILRDAEVGERGRRTDLQLGSNKSCFCPGVHASVGPVGEWTRRGQRASQEEIGGGERGVVGRS